MEENVKEGISLQGVQRGCANKEKRSRKDPSGRCMIGRQSKDKERDWKEKKHDWKERLHGRNERKSDRKEGKSN